MNKINFVDLENMPTRDISGFGGGYEETCQGMLKNGLRFLNGRKTFDWSGYKQLENVTGICIAENEDAKALDKAIMEGMEDASSAMHQAVVNHLFYIWKHGLKKWLEG